MSVEIYVQARMGSTRLPGKVLKTVLGRPLLSYQIERLKRVKRANAIVVVTSTAKEDDQIVRLCENEGIPCYRGAEEDVLDRYYQTAVQRRPDAVVRITADCPLIDPEIVDLVISKYIDEFPKWDYVSNSLISTFPRGLDTEIFSYRILEETAQQARALAEREHVTLYMYNHPERYKLKNVASTIDLSNYRWTVDTVEDFELIRLLLTELYPQKPDFLLQDVLDVSALHPEWSLINRNIQQKSVRLG